MASTWPCRANRISHPCQGLNAEDVADHALGLLIASWRNIVVGDRVVREGRWRNDDRMGPRPGLAGRKVGVVGLGAIGEAVARRVEACGMTVAWWGPNAKAAAWPRAESVLALAADSDILVVACRADASNRGLISQAVIEAVGPRGLIVNVARGSIIDEDALIAALKDGRLGRAALDVFADEPTPVERWEDVPGTVLTPHTAGGTVESIPRMVARRSTAFAGSGGRTGGQPGGRLGRDRRWARCWASGVFFKVSDNDEVRDWYARVLGFEVAEWGGVVFRIPPGLSVWSPFRPTPPTSIPRPPDDDQPDRRRSGQC